MNKYSLLGLTFFIAFITLSFPSFSQAQSPELDSLQKVLDNYTKEDTVKVSLLLEIVSLYDAYDEKFFPIAQKALELANKLNFQKGQVESLLNLENHYYYKSAYQKAFGFAEKALKIAHKIDDKNSVSICLTRMGVVYGLEGNYIEALTCYQKSFSIDEAMQSQDGMTADLINIGIIYRLQENNLKSLEYLNQALTISKKIADTVKVIIAAENIAGIYLERKKYDKALSYAQSNLELSKNLDDKESIAYSTGLIGSVYYEKGDYDKALGHVKEALDLFQEMGDKFGLCNNFLLFSKILLAKKEYDKSLNYAQKSLQITKKLDFLVEKKKAHELLAQIYEAKNNYKQAHLHYKQYKTLNDSIFNEKNIKELTTLEVQYKNDKEKQALALEQAKKDAIQKAEAKEQGKIRNLLILGIFLAVLIVLIVLYGFFQKKKANAMLSKQKLEIQSTNEELKITIETVNKQKEEITTSNEELNATLSKLYATQDQLIQSEKMASLGQLTAGVAHEVNNPLNFIQMGSQILENNLADNLLLFQKYAKLKSAKQEDIPELLEDITDFEEEIEYSEMLEENQETIKGIKEGAGRISAIVSSLNDFSQFQQADFNFFNIHKGLEATLALLAPQFNKDIKIIKNYDESITDIECYPSQINQVFLHLLNNANQAIEGAGEIVVSTKDIGNQIEISFKDTGSGIKEEIIDKIFDPFFSTKEIGEGTGLGLSTAYGIIQKHKGSIKVKSEVGKGTEFVIQLPKSAV